MKRKKYLFDKWFKYKAAVVVLISAAFTYLLWHVYYIRIDNVKEEELSIITAPKNIVVKPENPGGEIIPNKDKDIYNYIAGRGKISEKVKALSINEDNVSKEKAIASIKRQLTVIDSNTGKGKGYYLRVARLKNTGVFNKGLEIIKRKYPELASTYAQLHTEVKDGIFKYYICFGPIEDEEYARSMCKRLSGIRCKIVAK